MYIGPKDETEQKMWIYNSEKNKMNLKSIKYVPGLYKIFDEILVNAADNSQRDESMTKLIVNIDRVKNEFVIENNGQGIPVVIHKEHNIFVPELIFGNLMTSSNY